MGFPLCRAPGWVPSDSVEAEPEFENKRRPVMWPSFNLDAEVDERSPIQFCQAFRSFRLRLRLKALFPKSLFMWVLKTDQMGQ
jgi:hypothetical protein